MPGPSSPPAQTDLARPRSTAWVADGRHSAWLAGAVTALTLLMIVPEGLDYRALAAHAAPSAGDLPSRMLWLGLLLLSFGVIAWRHRLLRPLLHRINLGWLAFILLALASLAWSIDPALSARRLVRLVTISSVGLAFVLSGWQPRRLQDVLRPILTGVLAVSLVFGLVWPELAIHQQTAPELLGAWHGLTNHKNGLGDLACIGLVLWLHAGWSGESRRGPAVCGIVLAAACMLLSRSTTALAATVVGVGVLGLGLGLPPYWRRRLLPGLVLLLAGALLVYALMLVQLLPGLGTLMAPVAALTDKDSTMTGRTEIWTILFDHIAQRPLLGSGYGAYWTPEPSASTESYAFAERMGGFYPGSAHNGYLEVVNDLGWVGLAALMGYLAGHVRLCLRLLPLAPVQAVLYLALFFQQLVANLSETHWFSVLSVDFVLMTLLSAALARSLLEHDLRATFGMPPAGARPQARRVAAPARANATGWAGEAG